MRPSEIAEDRVPGFRLPGRFSQARHFALANRGQNLEKYPRIEWLWAQHEARIVAADFREHIAACQAGHEDNLAAGCEFLDMKRGIHAGHLLHAYVGYECMGPQRPGDIHRLFTAVDRGGFEAIEAKNESERVGDDLLVVGYEDAEDKL
jgi:hypothetical protein